MPATFDKDFALWLTQHGNERAVAVNVLEFRHEKWGPGGGVPGSLWVSDYGEDFSASTESAVAFTAVPLGLTIDVAADNVTTEQRIMIRLDNINGAVARELRSLNDDDLQQPVVVVYRAYLDTDRTAPAIDPLTLYATTVRMNRPIVEVEASADALPNVGAGTRYTLEAFRALAYL
jgi:hypothetical protein